LKLINPAPGFPLGSPFGPRRDPLRPDSGEVEFHSGLDIKTPTGTPLLAMSDGVVRFAGELSSSPASGIALGVDADDGRTFWSFAHLSEVLVRAGDRVTQGQVVAKSGSTGRSTGPHLHLTVKVDGERQDPARFIAAGAGAVGLAVFVFVARVLWRRFSR